ncbi:MULTISPECIES: DUF2969 domain-containing protein [unclassified Streptococcus]|uniref:DUF2969 domain-containing protein n=1 Tax=unclassified Streptococcus TaxID=2608887 RepID=UPI00107256AF|nr:MULTISPECIES: DUF2969 domain-containing protein [unclassified Streptococcus]MBF0786642.1 DUF2969 domain-containing protein [Streptococcus sp. 19428wC2_LYSM12]MCQ9212793.1 DUF2969 domain-containing protein [Streptococcus sp. B01]MCQ9214134.1 DUF2969 domain-containing protein [Streptococcus sp. O1]TFV06601.1 DUF2969 domain-containing protein [Streptococcus sp. LYSM12]
MSKKDKKIEIQLEEGSVQVNGEKFPGYTLTIGKKVIGEIAELAENHFAVMKNGNTESFYKKLEKAVGNVIENYNLHH